METNTMEALLARRKELLGSLARTQQIIDGTEPNGPVYDFAREMFNKLAKKSLTQAGVDLTFVNEEIRRREWALA
jgi:hypothetical protein